MSTRTRGGGTLLQNVEPSFVQSLTAASVLIGITLFLFWERKYDFLRGFDELPAVCPRLMCSSKITKIDLTYIIFSDMLTREVGQIGDKTKKPTRISQNGVHHYRFCITLFMLALLAQSGNKLPIVLAMPVELTKTSAEFTQESMSNYGGLVLPQKSKNLKLQPLAITEHADVDKTVCGGETSIACREPTASYLHDNFEGDFKSIIRTYQSLNTLHRKGRAWADFKKSFDQILLQISNQLPQLKRMIIHNEGVMTRNSFEDMFFHLNRCLKSPRVIRSALYLVFSTVNWLKKTQLIDRDTFFAFLDTSPMFFVKFSIYVLPHLERSVFENPPLINSIVDQIKVSLASGGFAEVITGFEDRQWKIFLRTFLLLLNQRVLRQLKQTHSFSMTDEFEAILDTFSSISHLQSLDSKTKPVEKDLITRLAIEIEKPIDVEEETGLSSPLNPASHEFWFSCLLLSYSVSYASEGLLVSLDEKLLKGVKTRLNLIEKVFRTVHELTELEASLFKISNIVVGLEEKLLREPDEIECLEIFRSFINQLIKDRVFIISRYGHEVSPSPAYEKITSLTKKLEEIQDEESLLLQSIWYSRPVQIPRGIVHINDYSEDHTEILQEYAGEVTNVQAILFDLMNANSFITSLVANHKDGESWDREMVELQKEIGKNNQTSWKSQLKKSLLKLFSRSKKNKVKPINSLAWEWQ